MRAPDQESYIGFFIDLSFPTSSKDNGFVKCDPSRHNAILHIQASDPEDDVFLFQVTRTATPTGASDEDTTKCPKIECPTSWSDTKLANGARSSQVSILGPDHR
ncbi:hypothetical protein FocTR4_00006207 [Fusarium oxysporum f. sp. cubense]|nr:hypothetical protein FocTR4_00006207 [Fusarium oxysporum f. sp. cubense]